MKTRIRNIEFPENEIGQFCVKWKVIELSLFGSVLRPDFTAESDIDVLVRFSDEADWGLFDEVEMEQELSSLLGRKVDLVVSKAIEGSTNWIRREAILNSAEPYYVAG